MILNFIFNIGDAMPFEEERKIFEDYLKSKRLKQSSQRDHILDVFLKTERHLKADELYRLVKKNFPETGFSTIYRTLKLLRECGLCNELILDDGTVRFEHLYGHEHHDHLICTKCGKFVEIMEPQIEKLQLKLAKKEGFVLQNHRLLLYGKCGKCKKK